MCKLAYASNLKKLTAEKKNKLFKTIQKNMTTSNRSGYGIASKTASGTIETKKSLDVTIPIHYPTNAPNFCKSKSIGNIMTSKAIEVIFHARTSTNSISIENTHPYVIGNTTLCHNGVLDYTGENYAKKTDNDTEDLTYYFDKYHMTNIDSVFTGYAAFIAFKNDSTYIVKDSTANLSYAYSKTLDCHFFATSESTLKDINEALGLKMPIFEIEDNQYIEIKNNKIVDNQTWAGLKYSSYASSKSHLSLGYSLDSYGNYNQFNKYWDRQDTKNKTAAATESPKIFNEITQETIKVNDSKLEYLGKLDQCFKDYFNKFSDLADSIEAKELVAKLDGKVLSSEDLKSLEFSNLINQIDLYWTA